MDTREQQLVVGRVEFGPKLVVWPAEFGPRGKPKICGLCGSLDDAHLRSCQVINGHNAKKAALRQHPKKVEITSAGTLLREIVEAWDGSPGMDGLLAINEKIDAAREFLQE